MSGVACGYSSGIIVEHTNAALHREKNCNQPFLKGKKRLFLVRVLGFWGIY